MLRRRWPELARAPVLGLACARAFLAAGARVTIVGRKEEKLRGAAAGMEAGVPGAGDVHPVVCDVTEEEAVQAAMTAAEDHAPTPSGRPFCVTIWLSTKVCVRVHDDTPYGPVCDEDPFRILHRFS